MTNPPVRPSPFNQVFDVVVVGSGYAGFAAAIALRQRDLSVLLIGERGDLVWESGRAFCPDTGDLDHPEWRGLVAEVARRGGVSGGWMDGAITEVVATDRLLESGATALYYAHPISVECDSEAVRSLIVATKSGLRRVAGRQWIDASESGLVLRMLDPTLRPPSPERTEAYLMLQHAAWSNVHGSADLEATAWPTERVLRFEVRHDDAAWREQALVRLEQLEEAIGAEIANASVSHWSAEPIARYAPGPVIEAAAVNVTSASPGYSPTAVRTLADRYTLGLGAAARLRHCDVHDVTAGALSQPLPRVEANGSLTADVCVVGTGTGGAVAALAASTAGTRVVCVEPLAFVGGIGTGGGIHGYWYGVAGGLQQEVDRGTRELMKRFCGGPFGDGPFNPWAKMIVLEQMLRAQGVDLRTGALLFDVEKVEGRVTAALVAMRGEVLRVEASSFVDGTGDGDLAAMAGARFTYGREHDGLLHAYTQSSGRLRDVRGRPRMEVVNFDAGFCDPTDPEDLTRARLSGVRQYLLRTYDNLSRPTYIAPAIGLRQGRQIETEYTLTLDDQIRRRRFDDPIAYGGSHYDCHSTDYEFESDEAVFWVWANRQHSRPVAYEMSYRMIVPDGVANVWLGSRCLGVSQDAHYIARMQRDIQRVGEAAGFAAAEAAKRGESAAQLPYPELRKWLDLTGALDKEPRRLSSRFGDHRFDNHPFGHAGANAVTLSTPKRHPAPADALAALDRGEPGEAIWWLYQNETLVRDDVLARLEASEPSKPMVSWLAATIVAMWGDPAAETRLLGAIDSVEFGFGGDYDWVAEDGPSSAEVFAVDHAARKPSDPLVSNKVVPNWLCAVALLRRCGTEACIAPIARLVGRPTHGINTLTSVAITLARLARRGAISGDEAARRRVGLLLDRLLATRVAGEFDLPERSTGRHSELAIRGVDDLGTADHWSALPPAFQQQLRNTYDDRTWQLYLAVLQARSALDLPVEHLVTKFGRDQRAFVRRAFESYSLPLAQAVR